MNKLGFFFKKKLEQKDLLTASPQVSLFILLILTSLLAEITGFFDRMMAEFLFCGALSAMR